MLGSAVLNAEIFSIQTGGKVARTTSAIINPANLQIIAFEVSGPLVQQHPALMLLSDVRELSNMGFIVDDIDQFIAPTDVVRVNDVYQLKFDIIGKLVLDEKRHKLGKVIDFTIDTTQFLIMQLSVKRPLLRSFNDTEILVHRSQIIEINNDSIVVHSQAKAPEPELHEVVGSYINPFRKPKQARQNSDID
ncbi:hypothetical protein EUA61_00380 [TM7 phylum sp. oral taxon 346]|nr:hypothetical protein EUA61_00380 [TM7 phylum sp. oral taxon 346]